MTKARAEGTAGPGDFSLPFQEAIDFLRQKVNLPTRTWRDIDGRAHDRAFVVAGATKEALLADLRAAVDAGVANGETLAMFRGRFGSIVKKHGWTGWTGEGSRQGVEWRTRVIYETNIRTAYAAGRYRQMKDPDLVKVRPYWQYRHGDTRIPLHPRANHLAWNGLVLPHDDPWWSTHYPPNGWFCSCGVRPVSRRELARMGKDAPDQAPAIETRDVVDPVTGETVAVPKGIDFGWDHAPGRSWAEGLVPPPLQRPLPSWRDLPPGVTSTPVDKPSLPLWSPRPSAVQDLPAGLADTDYVDAFLKEFGAVRGADGAVAWRDPAGHVIVISDELFKTRAGAWKVEKGKRATGLLRVAEALRDPDEIWLDWEVMQQGPSAGQGTLRRRYVRVAPEALGVFEWGADGWEGRSAFPPDADKEKDRLKYLDRVRHGVLLWRRLTE